MRSLVPAETLVYLETNDLAAALQPIVDAKPFVEAAKSKPDLSALKGIQLAVAVTGFETKEEVLTDEQSVGRIQPRFVAIAETYAWNYQAVAFAETKLGQFVTDLYGTDVTEERVDSANGKELTWISADGRKSYALVTGSVIYFTNDETGIAKCLAVKRGEADSILKTDKIKPSETGTLARGYVTTEGVAQIANIVGLKFATEASEESEIRSAIAGIVPKLIRGTITDVTWTMTKGELGIEDKYAIGMPPDIANVFTETMVATETTDPVPLQFVPVGTRSVTQYNIKNPQVAWRSMLSTSKKLTDTLGVDAHQFISASTFWPYSIADGEAFLSAVGPGIVTVRNDEEETQAVISRVNSKELPAKSYYPDVVHAAPVFIQTENSETVVLQGDSEMTLVCQKAHQSGSNMKADTRFSGKSEGVPSARTLVRDEIVTSQIVDILSAKNADASKAVSTYFTETRFTKSGMERRTVSDFGLIGQIIAQLSDD